MLRTGASNFVADFEFKKGLNEILCCCKIIKRQNYKKSFRRRGYFLISYFNNNRKWPATLPSFTTGGARKPPGPTTGSKPAVDFILKTGQGNSVADFVLKTG